MGLAADMSTGQAVLRRWSFPAVMVTVLPSARDAVIAVHNMIVGPASYGEGTRPRRAPTSPCRTSPLGLTFNAAQLLVAAPAWSSPGGDQATRRGARRRRWWSRKTLPAGERRGAADPRRARLARSPPWCRYAGPCCSGRGHRGVDGGDGGEQPPGRPAGRVSTILGENIARAVPLISDRQPPRLRRVGPRPGRPGGARGRAARTRKVMHRQERRGGGHHGHHHQQAAR